VAGEVARSLMRNQTYITSVENLESSLEILKVLIREGIQQATGYPGGPIQRRAQETEETIEEQGWLARIVHLIRGKDNDTQFKVGPAIRHFIDSTNDRPSFCKQRERLSPKATSVSSTPLLLS
jgi:vacuolar protein sorting-associated protein 35